MRERVRENDRERERERERPNSISKFSPQTTPIVSFLLKNVHTLFGNGDSMQRGNERNFEILKTAKKVEGEKKAVQNINFFNREATRVVERVIKKSLK